MISMRKRVLKIILISLLFMPFCYANVQYSTQEELKKIEDEFQKCINKNNMTDYAMMQCTTIGMKKYNKEIEKTIKAGKELLSKEQYKQFLLTQKKWEEFMTEENKFLSQTYEKKCPPYLPCLMAASDKYEYTKNRAQDLSGFFGILTLFSKEGVLDDGLNFVEFKY